MLFNSPVPYIYPHNYPYPNPNNNTTAHSSYPPYSNFQTPPTIPTYNQLKNSLSSKNMSGVWVFKNNGVMQLVENPSELQMQSNGYSSSRGSRSSSNNKVLVHLPTEQVVSSYTFLEQILRGLGWERYYDGDPDLFQFHKHSTIDLISLPRDFARFNSIYMYDIVVKNPNVFHVRDI